MPLKIGLLHDQVILITVSQTTLRIISLILDKASLLEQGYHVDTDYQSQKIKLMGP